MPGVAFFHCLTNHGETDLVSGICYLASNPLCNLFG